MYFVRATLQKKKYLSMVSVELFEMTVETELYPTSNNCSTGKSDKHLLEKIRL